MSYTLMTSLQNANLFDHSTSCFQVIETHISWVLLTGNYAYKIKKSVNFGFLDFSELDQRAFFCKEELRLNQALTKNLYLEVIPITGSEHSPVLNGDGPIIEYALKMHQFEQDQLFSQLQINNRLKNDHIASLASTLAYFHIKAISIDKHSIYGTADKIYEPMAENFQQIHPLLTNKQDIQQLEELKNWTEESFMRLKPLLGKRKAAGFIRECHGDIHLENITLHNGDVAVFDCIEFNDSFRMTDIISDIAFLIMDLDKRKLNHFSNTTINTWVEITNDYQSLELLPFYKMYRALVRAKINLFQRSQTTDEHRKELFLNQYREFASLAKSYTKQKTPFLIITKGLSASGKSHIAHHLVNQLGATRLRSDIERKRLSLNLSPSNDIYNKKNIHSVYNLLHDKAKQLLQQGTSVVIDATYLQKEHRQAAKAIATDYNTPFIILDCHASESTIHERCTLRLAEKNDPSDATLNVIAQQKLLQDALTKAEKNQTIHVNTEDFFDAQKLISQVKEHLNSFPYNAQD